MPGLSQGRRTLVRVEGSTPVVGLRGTALGASLGGADVAGDQPWHVHRSPGTGLRPRAAGGVATLPDVHRGLARARAGLDEVGAWLRHVGASGRGAEPRAVTAVVSALASLDAAALAAVSRAVVLAEESRCAAADGSASPADWVAATTRSSARAARAVCRLAADLDGLPDVLESLEDGRISRDHAVELVHADRQQRKDQEAAERARQQAERERAEQARRDAEAAAQAAADAAEAERIRRHAEEDARAAAERARAEAARRRDEEEAARRRRQEDLLGRAAQGASPDEVADEAAARRADDADALPRRRPRSGHSARCACGATG
jgi:hypothetical protein